MLAPRPAGESSYSHHNDPQVGLSVIDRFTHVTLDFFEAVSMESNVSLDDLVHAYT